MGHRRLMRWLLHGIILAVVVLLSPTIFAQTVQWGYSMDQAFSANVYTNDGGNYIPYGWTNLPWNNPAGWPIQGTTNNSWAGKRYVEDGTTAPRTVTAGQSFYLSVPRSLEDACRVSNYGTRGYWRDLMVVTNNAGQEAWNWNPPGGSWYNSTATGLNITAQYCSPGGNYSGSWGFDLTAPSVTSTQHYQAVFFAEEGQYTSAYSHNNVDGDISEIAVPIVVRPSAPAPTIALSANPTALNVGQAATLTATASNLPNGDYLTIWQPTTDTEWGSGYAGENPDSTTVTQNTPQSDTFVAHIENRNGVTIATSNTVQVTWNAAETTPSPMITLTASPTYLPTGNATILNATTSNLPGGDYIDLRGTDGLAQTTDSATLATSDTQYVPGTVTYTASIMTPSGHDVANSSPVVVTWYAHAPPEQAWTVSLSAQPTQLPAGSATTVTATANQNVGPTPYYINIVDKTTGAVLTSCGSGTSCTTTMTETQATTQTFQADVGRYDASPGGGTEANSNQLSVTWTAANNVQLQLTGNPLILMVGQSTTLTATANQPFSNAYLAGIVQVSGTPVASTGGQEYAGYNTGTSFDWLVTANQPETATFQLRWAVTSSGPVIDSRDVTITWASPPTVSLTANPAQLDTGQPTTITATANQTMTGTGNDINIVDTTTGSMVASCATGTTCTGTLTEYQATTQQFKADIGPYHAAPSAAGVAAISSPVSVTWVQPSVSLTANPTNLPTGQATTLTATAADLPSGDAIAIIGSDHLSYTGSSNASSVRTTDTHTNPDTVTYTAYIVNHAGQHLWSPSNTQTVVWTAPAVSGCVPYRPGYEYEHGRPTYNPTACPVPTPVNF